MEAEIAQIHRLIMKGQGGQARAELIRRVARRVPRRSAARWARLACRASLPELGVRLLHPIVRPTPSASSCSAIEEHAEYANCLIRYGAVEEGMRMLEELD